MAGICFFYEDYEVDVWSGHNFDAWNYACKLAGDIDKAIVINKTSQTLTSFDKAMDVQFVADIDEANATMTGEVIYLACPWEVEVHPVSLASYPHTADWYVFGPAAGWGNHEYGNCFYLPQAGTGAVHSVHAATTVMFHRYWVLHYGG